jgi:putative Holliday junction resolvase
MKYLAIDYGTKRTGLAVCDRSETITSPLTVIQGQKDLIKKISEIVNKEEIEVVVLGLPLNMDGSEGAQSQKVLKFGKQLQNNLKIPVLLQDERLSSFGAEEKLDPANFTRGKRKKRIDAVAAAEILQSFLEQQKSHKSAGSPDIPDNS